MTRSDVGPYSIVPKWLLETGISDGALRLYMELAMRADRDDDSCWPSRRTLAKAMRVSDRTVDARLKELVALQAVSVVPRHAPGSVERLSNRYVVKFASPPPVSTFGTGGEAGFSGTKTISIQNQEPEELAPPALVEASIVQRPRDPVWDALVDCFGEPTTSGRGAYNAAAKVLRDYGADPDEMRAFVGICRHGKNSWAVVSPNALAKHYGSRAQLLLEPDPAARLSAWAGGLA